MRLDGLRFLVGRWRGEGTLRGEAVTTRSRPALAADGSLRLEVLARQGEVVRRERVTFREDDSGVVVSTTEPRPGVTQRWSVEDVDGVIVLRSPGFVWHVLPGDRDYEEMFDAVAPDGRTTRIVALRHVRREGPAR